MAWVSLNVEVGKLDVDGPVQVIGDGPRLRQVFDNLLTNIRTHTPAGTPARIRVHRNGTTAVLVVDDEGPGMTEDEAARAFERFYRVDPSRARTSGGVGLGLSIVNAIVAAHEGEVKVEAHPGQGARFTVTLPIGGPAEAAEPAPTEDQPSVAEQSLTTEHQQELDEPVVFSTDGPEARVGDVPVGEGDRDRAADPDGVA